MLRRLATEGRLEDVVRLSTVSGGSLVTAMLFSHNRLKWPDSDEFRDHLYPHLRTLLTTTSLATMRTFLLSMLHSPRRVLFHRASIVVDLLERRWGVTGSFGDLPQKPEWRINATCYESGKNWRFCHEEMGDWLFGRYYHPPPFRIAEAAAASAAVPYVIGALTLKLPTTGWSRSDPATGQPLGPADPMANKVRLWDGGAYENLGLEALYKPARGAIGCDFVLVSDASGPLPDVAGGSSWSALGGNLSAPRLFEIAGDQIRGLRSRTFINAVQAGKVSGALVRMGNTTAEIDHKAGRSAGDYTGFQDDADAAVALTHPTNLDRLTEAQFDTIARNGFEAADATLAAYCGNVFTTRYHWPEGTTGTMKALASG